ncbi:MAG TPA: hypothetical protein VHS31_00055, partial [Tepidisphaeraceae bacterium]|nr:hypothetical protein [Tepidisphaeraceae bacterium]
MDARLSFSRQDWTILPRRDQKKSCNKAPRLLFSRRACSRDLRLISSANVVATEQNQDSANRKKKVAVDPDKD